MFYQVLGDQGVCCIDELDNIACDHHALLEAMEQQSVSVAKSGVVTSLKSRYVIICLYVHTCVNVSLFTPKNQIFVILC